MIRHDELESVIDENGNKRFAQWLEGLDAAVAAKVTIALARMEQGNLPKVKVKSVGSGVFEYKTEFGPGLPDLLGNGDETGDRHHIFRESLPDFTAPHPSG